MLACSWRVRRPYGAVRGDHVMLVVPGRLTDTSTYVVRNSAKSRAEARTVRPPPRRLHRALQPAQLDHGAKPRSFLAAFSAYASSFVHCARSRWRDAHFDTGQYRRHG